MARTRSLVLGAGAVVLAGVAVGRPRRPPAEVAERRRHDLEPNPTGAGVVVAVNPGAGSSGADVASELRRLLPEADVVLLDDPAQLVPTLEDAVGRPDVRAIGVAGGDGSVNAAAAVALEHGVPLLVLPGGTLNHLATDLDLGTVEDAVAALVAGRALELDVARLDGRPFLNTASFGAYADLVDEREALEARLGKWPALAVAAVRVLRRGEPVGVELDGSPHRLWMVFIGNCRYRPDGFAPSRRPRLDDGQLDVRIVDARHPWSRLRLVLGLLTGRLGDSPVYGQWATTSMEVRADRPLRLACDGETFDGGAVVSVVKAGERLAVFAGDGPAGPAS